MSQEVIIKKSENDFYGAVPELGILEKATSPQAAFDQAFNKSQEIKQTYSALQLEHLLKNSEERVSIKVWNSQQKKMFIILILAILAGFTLFGLTVASSIQRASESLKSNMFETDPKRMEKNREKFRLLLEKYRPLIEEWQKATEKK